MTTIEAFVRVSGDVLGSVREAFGPGGQAPLAPAGIDAPPAAPAASGQAADQSGIDSTRIGAGTAALGEHDQTSRKTLTDAITAAGEGRGRMDSIIAAALADVGDADISTPQGQRELVEAITKHLEDSKTTLDGASTDAGTRAAAAHTTAAGYNSVAPMQAQAPMMMPAGGMPAGGGMPTAGGGGMPMPGLSALASGLPSLLHPQASAPASDTAETVKESAVHAAPLIGSDPRSVARYIYGRARLRGYTPYQAWAISSYPNGESGYKAAISGGPQGGPGYKNTVIGEFQEKPDFASSVGIDPALRYTVEGNTEAYLRQLERHRNDPGDIIDHLAATSGGGPAVTGGRSEMARLMAQTRELLGEVYGT